jgi:hypothetical protein
VIIVDAVLAVLVLAIALCFLVIVDTVLAVAVLAIAPTSLSPYISSTEVPSQLGGRALTGLTSLSRKSLLLGSTTILCKALKMIGLAPLAYLLVRAGWCDEDKNGLAASKKALSACRSF